MSQAERKPVQLHRGGLAQTGTGVADGLFHLRFDPPFLILAGRTSAAALDVLVPGNIRGSELYLVTDIYLRDRPVHPAGHVGWWRFAISGGTTLALDVRIEERHVSVVARHGPDIDRWVNPDLDLPPGETLVMHLVYRQQHNDSIAHSQSLHIYRDAGIAAMAAQNRASIAGDLSSIASLPRAPFQWPAASTIHIVAQSLPPLTHIARNGSALQLAKLLVREGMTCRLYAASFDPELRGPVSHIGDLAEAVAPDDVLVIVCNDYLPDLPWLSRLPCTKIFYFLGLPISIRLQAFDAEAYEHYVKAQALIRHIVDCDIWAASTAADAKQLAHYLVKASLPDGDDESQRSLERSNSGALPNEAASRKVLARLAPADRMLLEEGLGSGKSMSSDRVAIVEHAVARKILRCRLPSREGIWAATEAADAPAIVTSGRVLLFSGRFAPGERVVELMELFAEFAKITTDSQLLIAGDQPVPAFFHYVEYLLKTRFAECRDRVRLLASPGDRLLKAFYGRADALIHLGPGGIELLADAVHFAKPLFTAGDLPGQETGDVRPGYHLYGKDRRMQASRLNSILDDEEALRNVLDRQRRDLADLTTAHDNLSIWALFELAAARAVAS